MPYREERNRLFAAAMDTSDDSLGPDGLIWVWPTFCEAIAQLTRVAAAFARERSAADRAFTGCGPDPLIWPRQDGLSGLHL